MLAPAAVRIPGPTLAPEPPKPRFPLVATAAPVLASGVLFAVTGSPFMLLMAALGPVIALATFVDGKRQRRSAAREALVRFEAGLGSAAAAVRTAQDAERTRLAGFTDLEPHWGSADFPLVLAAGRGAAPSGIEVGTAGSADDCVAVARLRLEAATIADAPLLRPIDTGLAVDGPPALAAAVARTLALRTAARLSPATTSCDYPPGEDWAAQLPHDARSALPGRYRFASADREIVIAWGAGCEAAGPRLPARAADATTRATARQAARRLATAALAAGVRAPASGLPDSIPLGELLPVVPGPGLSAPLGIAPDGAAVLDLVADGPHAVVAGTTGAGKSELLVSWVLGMAAGRTPDEVSFVLVDFKGGAAFAPLAGLPHVLGTLSDLDERLARRAIESLRAEVLRRERTLAEAGARSITELSAGSLARLVVVVDEFAALVTELPELHALFTDLAARGRSLGVHLVLCTQRPAGVVRDALLANVSVRIALRLADRADSLGLLGDESAALLPAYPRGRAVIVDASGRRRTVQVGLAGAADVARIALATPAGSSSRPWRDPLPPVVPHASLPPATGIPFGLRDLPAQQQQPTAAIESRHGHVLVLGTSGAGKTTALASVAAGAPESACWLPADPVGLWGVLTEPAGLPDEAVVLLDDLDLVLARCDADHAPELAELVARLLREAPVRGIRVVAAARRLAGPIPALAGYFGARLVLRLGSREEHLLAGGDGAGFDPRSVPGCGSWDGAAVQVALPEPATRRTTAGPQPVRIDPRQFAELAIVAARPGEFAAGWEPERVRVVRLGEPDPGLVVTGADHTVLLGDPDAWQSDWSTLTRARRELPIVFSGCSVADLRAVARTRQVPPPLNPGEVWLVADGGVRRAVFDHPRVAPGEPDAPGEPGAPG